MAEIFVQPSTPGHDFKLLLAKYNELAEAFNTLLGMLDAEVDLDDTYVADLGVIDTIVTE